MVFSSSSNHLCLPVACFLAAGRSDRVRVVCLPGVPRDRYFIGCAPSGEAGQQGPARRSSYFAKRSDISKESTPSKHRQTLRGLRGPGRRLPRRTSGALCHMHISIPISFDFLGSCLPPSIFWRCVLHFPFPLLPPVCFIFSVQLSSPLL